MNGVVKCFFHMVVPTYVHGTAILISNKANCTELSTTADPLGRFIISKVQVDDKVYVLVNIYAPNEDKDSTFFFRKLNTLLQIENLDSEENMHYSRWRLQLSFKPNSRQASWNNDPKEIGRGEYRNLAKRVRSC